MSNVNTPLVQIEEVSSVLTPAEGVSLDDAIRDAELAGYRVIEIDRARNEARITWFKRGA